MDNVVLTEKTAGKKANSKPPAQPPKTSALMAKFLGKPVQSPAEPNVAKGGKTSPDEPSAFVHEDSAIKIAESSASTASSPPSKTASAGNAVCTAGAPAEAVASTPINIISPDKHTSHAPAQSPGTAVEVASSTVSMPPPPLAGKAGGWGFLMSKPSPPALPSGSPVDAAASNPPVSTPAPSRAALPAVTVRHTSGEDNKVASTRWGGIFGQKMASGPARAASEGLVRGAGSSSTKVQWEQYELPYYPSEPIVGHVPVVQHREFHKARHGGASTEPDGDHPHVISCAIWDPPTTAAVRALCSHAPATPVSEDVSQEAATGTHVFQPEVMTRPLPALGDDVARALQHPAWQDVVQYLARAYGESTGQVAEAFGQRVQQQKEVDSSAMEARVRKALQRAMHRAYGVQPQSLAPPSSSSSSSSTVQNLSPPSIYHVSLLLDGPLSKGGPFLSTPACTALFDSTWPVKYRPMCAQEVCGNRKAVATVHRYLQRWREAAALPEDEFLRLREAAEREVAAANARAAEQAARKAKEGTRRKGNRAHTSDDEAQEGFASSSSSDGGGSDGQEEDAYLQDDEDEDDVEVSLKDVRESVRCSHPTSAGRGKGGAGRRQRRGYEEDDSCGGGSVDDVGRLPPLLIVTGPTGCGKTAAVYACAEECGYSVIEVHPGQARDKSSLLAMLKEATQSRRVRLSSTGVPAHTPGLQGGVSTTDAKKSHGGISSLLGLTKPEQASALPAGGNPPGQRTRVIVDSSDEEQEAAGGNGSSTATSKAVKDQLAADAPVEQNAEEAGGRRSSRSKGAVRYAIDSDSDGDEAVQHDAQGQTKGETRTLGRRESTKTAKSSEPAGKRRKGADSSKASEPEAAAAVTPSLAPVRGTLFGFGVSATTVVKAKGSTAATAAAAAEEADASTTSSKSKSKSTSSKAPPPRSMDISKMFAGRTSGASTGTQQQAGTEQDEVEVMASPARPSSSSKADPPNDSVIIVPDSAEKGKRRGKGAPPPPVEPAHVQEEPAALLDPRAKEASQAFLSHKHCMEVVQEVLVRVDEGSGAELHGMLVDDTAPAIASAKEQLPTTAPMATSTGAALSCILFEAADCLFPAGTSGMDLGFLSAIRELANETRTPILITVTRPLVGAAYAPLHGMYPAPVRVHMRRPAMDEAGLLLSTVSLAEGCGMTRGQISRLLHATQCDIRACLMQMQAMYSHLPVTLPSHLPHAVQQAKEGLQTKLDALLLAAQAVRDGDWAFFTAGAPAMGVHPAPPPASALALDESIEDPDVATAQATESSAPVMQPVSLADGAQAVSLDIASAEHNSHEDKEGTENVTTVEVALAPAAVQESSAATSPPSDGEATSAISALPVAPPPVVRSPAVDTGREPVQSTASEPIDTGREPVQSTASVQPAVVVPSPPRGRPRRAAAVAADSKLKQIAEQGALIMGTVDLPAARRRRGAKGECEDAGDADGADGEWHAGKGRAGKRGIQDTEAVLNRRANRKRKREEEAATKEQAAKAEELRLATTAALELQEEAEDEATALLEAVRASTQARQLQGQARYMCKVGVQAYFTGSEEGDMERDRVQVDAAPVIALQAQPAIPISPSLLMDAPSSPQVPPSTPPCTTSSHPAWHRGARAGPLSVSSVTPTTVCAPHDAAQALAGTLCVECRGLTAAKSDTPVTVLLAGVPLSPDCVKLKRGGMVVVRLYAPQLSKTVARAVADEAGMHATVLAVPRLSGRDTAGPVHIALADITLSQGAYSVTVGRAIALCGEPSSSLGALSISLSLGTGAVDLFKLIGKRLSTWRQHEGWTVQGHAGELAGAGDKGNRSGKGKGKKGRGAARGGKPFSVSGVKRLRKRAESAGSQQEGGEQAQDAPSPALPPATQVASLSVSVGLPSTDVASQHLLPVATQQAYTQASALTGPPASGHASSVAPPLLQVEEDNADDERDASEDGGEEEEDDDDVVVRAQSKRARTSGGGTTAGETLPEGQPLASAAATVDVDEECEAKNEKEGDRVFDPWNDLASIGEEGDEEEDMQLGAGASKDADDDEISQESVSIDDLAILSSCCDLLSLCDVLSVPRGHGGTGCGPLLACPPPAPLHPLLQAWTGGVGKITAPGLAEQIRFWDCHDVASSLPECSGTRVGQEMCTGMVAGGHALLAVGAGGVSQAQALAQSIVGGLGRSRTFLSYGSGQREKGEEWEEWELLDGVPEGQQGGQHGEAGEDHEAEGEGGTHSRPPQLAKGQSMLSFGVSGSGSGATGLLSSAPSRDLLFGQLVGGRQGLWGDEAHVAYRSEEELLLRAPSVHRPLTVYELESSYLAGMGERACAMLGLAGIERVLQWLREAAARMQAQGLWARTPGMLGKGLSLPYDALLESELLSLTLSASRARQALASTALMRGMVPAVLLSARAYALPGGYAPATAACQGRGAEGGVDRVAALHLMVHANARAKVEFERKAKDTQAQQAVLLGIGGGEGEGMGLRRSTRAAARQPTATPAEAKFKRHFSSDMLRHVAECKL